MRHGLSSLSVTILVCVCSAGLVTAQSVDEIVAKNLEAKGGAARIAAVTTVKMTGRVTLQGMDAPLTIMMKRPNMVIQEMMIQGQRVVQAFDGERAWMLNPMSNGPQELQGEQVELMKDQTDFAGVLADYKTKGHTVELAGSDIVQGKKTNKLKVTRKNGQVQYLDLDVESGLEVRSTTELDQQGNKVTIESLLSNYRAESGVMMPHTMLSTINGQPMSQITLDRVEFGVTIADVAFKMPPRSPFIR